MCMNRYYFGKYCMAIEFLVLVFYINSVSTSNKDYNTSNSTNVFKNNETVLYNTTISEVSSSHKIFGISKQQENDFDLSEIIVHLDAALQERLIQNLDKEDTEFLRWLDIDIDSEPSESLARLKGFRRQTSKALGLQEKKILEHLSFNKNLLSHSVSHKKLKQGKESAQVRSQTRLEKIIPELRSIYDSSSLDPSLKRPKSGAKIGSLKRLKRQADLEPPRWPGMPTEVPGVLRNINNGIVKRKLIDMMLQSLYSAQERVGHLGPIEAKYGHLAPYRMAFIFLKLDQLVHESHSIKMYIDSKENLVMTERLQLYSHILRRNIDVTYLVDYIMERVPKDQVVRIRQQLIRHEQEKIMENHAVHLKTVTHRQRPTNKNKNHD
ncbi:uncharacterized protein LOC134679237 [Cydia fagiglandana]|uniref:uncharacterized protein LOC134679237 n=1 Tax=Cydia fagiglandana TaxID=1458189 RepID=UPI002FEE2A79